MNSKLSFIALLATGLLFAPLASAQENPLDDPDLQEALKQAKELQKGGTPAKMTDLQKQAAQIAAQQEEEEAQEKQKLKAALQKQLAESGPLIFPEWTPTTPQFKATGSPSKKIVDDQVKIIQTGTSPADPEVILKAWEAAVTDKPLNHVYNRGMSNGSVSNRLDISTRNEPLQKVRLEARREEGAKITQVTISSALPKPGEDSE